MSATSIRDCFLRACWLDVAVRKPGNVSLASAGHRMQAAQFVASAQASAAPLCRRGARVGERIESAMEATWRAVGCNTNLGILLLCAPLACAAEREGACLDADALRRAAERVLSGLDVEDARAAYRAIALAQPGGLGEAPEQDVHQVPTLGLREAMALAASRDTIARQYADGFAELFTIGLAALPSGFALRGGVGDARAEAAETAAVQRVYLGYLRAIPDSHIVRKHGEGVAQTVMAAAQQRAGGLALPDEHVIAGWDESLKAQGINPGTSADLTVATLFAAGLLRAAWHGT